VYNRECAGRRESDSDSATGRRGDDIGRIVDDTAVRDDHEHAKQSNGKPEYEYRVSGSSGSVQWVYRYRPSKRDSNAKDEDRGLYVDRFERQWLPGCGRGRDQWSECEPIYGRWCISNEYDDGE
jgi:hypothetical protein